MHNSSFKSIIMIIDLIHFDVYFPNSIHTRIQITCDVDKSTLWHKERTLEGLWIGQFAYIANDVYSLANYERSEYNLIIILFYWLIKLIHLVLLCLLLLFCHYGHIARWVFFISTESIYQQLTDWVRPTISIPCYFQFVLEKGAFQVDNVDWKDF